MLNWKSIGIHAFFILVMLIVGVVSAKLFPPGIWYQNLNKPSFTPPNYVFPIAWNFLFVLIGVAGARVWLKGLLGLPFLFWITQLGLNGLWSYLFFGLQSPLAALIEILILWSVIFAFIQTTRSDDRVTAYLFVPYLMWVSFAIVLNAAVWWMN